MRFGCILVSAAMLVSFVVDAPKTEAFAVTTGTVYALVGAFLAACGLVPVVTGMADTDEVGEAIAQVVQDYLTAEVGGQSVLEWAGDIAKVGASPTGSLILPRMMAEKLAQFASWVASKFVAKPGINEVFGDSSVYVILADGSKFYLCFGYDSATGRFKYVGTPISSVPTTIIFSSGCSLVLTSKRHGSLYDADGNVIYTRDNISDYWPLYICVEYWCSSSFIVMYDFMNPSGYALIANGSVFDVGTIYGLSGSFGFNATETYQQILDRLTALEEGQSVALDVGATQSMETQEILQSVLDAILAGNLAASAEVVDEAVVPVDPPAETLPDVDGLGLPALGAALTSRFPFSIPWDVYKGVQLLAAPAEAPYFEVDFMEPIAYRVGGWKGSTKIVLDFSEYEIIGQVCRWTSTVGFCLMLAAATKRLVWTA